MVELQRTRTELCIAAGRGGNTTAYGVNDPDEFELRQLSADICAGHKLVRTQFLQPIYMLMPCKLTLDFKNY